MFHPQLLLMKRGGRVIYGGKVGERSNILIKYFEVKKKSFIMLQKEHCFHGFTFSLFSFPEYKWNYTDAK